ncbi:MAG: DUF2934 domain-containing protein [Verrucomicrobia bacterium]|nr:DUF2934 domain-containing protein [Cytophagales bacterium]
MSSDITLCAGGDCPIKQKCYRFLAEILGRQDFFGQLPYNFDTNSCEYFWENRPDKGEIRLRAYQIWQEKGCPEGKSTEIWLQAEKERSR